MSLTKTRAWVAGTVVVCLLLSIAAWFLLISPQRAEAQALREQTVSAQQANDATKVRIAGLKKEFANLEVRQAELASLQSALPEDDQLAAFTREVDGIAKSSTVSLDSVTPSVPVAVVPPAAPAPATAEAASEGSDDAAAADAAAATTQQAASAGLVEIPVTIVVTGNYQANLNFLQGLQAQIKRNYLVTGLTIDAPPTVVDTKAGTAEAKRAEGWATMTITGKVFALPADAAAPAPAAAAGATTTTAN